MEESGMMRKQWLSLALGVSLTFGSVGSAFAQTTPGSPTGQGTSQQSGQQMSPTAMAQKALQDFYDYTAKNWAAEGYSSVAEMRQALGNSQTEWLTATIQQAGGPTVAAQIANGTFKPGQASQSGSTTSGTGSGSNSTTQTQSGSGTQNGTGTSGTGNTGTNNSGTSNTGTNNSGTNNTGSGGTGSGSNTGGSSGTNNPGPNNTTQP
jgi:hypothetical protein